jgi:polyisoprenoid-binding protein YceI
MPRWDAASAECRIFVEREGLLSAVGHDVELAVRRFELSLDDAWTRLEATFDPTSLEVTGALRDGRRLPGAFSADDRRRIEENTVREVLDAARHPRIAFHSSAIVPVDGGWEVTGALELHGTTRPLDFRIRARNDTWSTSVPLHQPDFGIRPYRAALGALRVKPDVRVELRAPRPEVAAGLLQ